MTNHQEYSVRLYPHDKRYIIDGLKLLVEQKRKLVEQHYKPTEINSYWTEWAQVCNLINYLEIHFTE